MNYLEYWKKFSIKWLIQIVYIVAIIIICSMLGIGPQYVLVFLIVRATGQQLIYSVDYDLKSKEYQENINHLYTRILDLEKFVLEKR